MKAFATDLKTIYTAPNEKTALKQLETVTHKWNKLNQFRIFSFLNEFGIPGLVPAPLRALD